MLTELFLNNLNLKNNLNSVVVVEQASAHPATTFYRPRWGYRIVIAHLGL